MSHKAVINTERATCSCGNMQGIWRPASETIGAFTKRAYACWEIHRDLAPADVRGELFDIGRIVRERTEPAPTLF